MPPKRRNDAPAYKTVHDEGWRVIAAARLPSAPRGAHVGLSARHDDGLAAGRGHERLARIGGVDRKILFRNRDLVREEALIEIADGPYPELAEVDLPVG